MMCGHDEVSINLNGSSHKFFSIWAEEVYLCFHARCSISEPDKNFHYVVKCGDHLMKDHCYWPLVSDLANVLLHQPVSYKFMTDDKLMDGWFTFLSYFQGELNLLHFSDKV